jgi:MFS family permease
MVCALTNVLICRKTRSRALDEDAASSRSIMLTLMAVSVLPFIQVSVLAPVLPAIAQSFPDNPNATFLARLLLVAPSASIVLSAAGVGYVIDRTVRKSPLLIGLVLYAICGVGAFASDSLELMVAFRFILGISLSILVTANTALIADYFTGAKRETALGWQNAARGLTNTLSPVPGALIAALNWRLVFLVTLISLLLVWPVLKLPKPPHAQTKTGDKFSYRSVFGIYFLAFAGFLILYLLTLQIAFHLAELGHDSFLLPALSLAIAALTAATCSTRYSVFRRWLSFEVVAALSYVFMSFGYLLIGSFPSLPVVIVGLVLAGFGFGLNAPNSIAWLLSRVRADARASALGGLTSAIFLGQIAAPFVYEPLVRAFGSGNAFLIVGVASLLVALSVKVMSPRILAAG